MKDKIVIIGGGGHAKSVISTIKKLDRYEILGYTDFKDNGPILGIKFIGSDEILPDILIKNVNCKAVIGIGSVGLSDKRIETYNMLKEIGFELPAIKAKSAIVKEEVSIGEGTVLLENVTVGIGSKIGRCVIINAGSIIYHQCSIGDFVHLAPMTYISSSSVIGNNSFIGIGAAITENIEIDESCLIGAGAAILNNVKKNDKYFGIPKFPVSNKNRVNTYGR
ncbi:MAG: acetyltransferase [Ignavibacterium sp.]|nr:acetyltransferase [Ignavibacterium sp.]